MVHICAQGVNERVVGRSITTMKCVVVMSWFSVVLSLCSQEDFFFSLSLSLSPSLSLHSLLLSSLTLVFFFHHPRHSDSLFHSTAPNFHPSQPFPHLAATTSLFHHFLLYLLRTQPNHNQNPMAGVYKVMAQQSLRRPCAYSHFLYLDTPKEHSASTPCVATWTSSLISIPPFLLYYFHQPARAENPSHNPKPLACRRFCPNVYSSAPSRYEHQPITNWQPKRGQEAPFFYMLNMASEKEIHRTPPTSLTNRTPPSIWSISVSLRWSM
jgi:hypothetical protein